MNMEPSWSSPNGSGRRRVRGRTLLILKEIGPILIGITFADYEVPGRPVDAIEKVHIAGFERFEI